MTTSYELSLRLKDLGVEQTGEYYWVQTETGKVFRGHFTSYVCSDDNYEVLCRAFTLGELVRMMPDFITLMRLNGKVQAGYMGIYKYSEIPEEAAAELVIELVESGVIKFEPPVAPNEKDFAQWITEDALPTTKDILAELREINRKRDEAKSWLTENNIDITEEAIEKRISYNELNQKEG